MGIMNKMEQTQEWQDAREVLEGDLLSVVMPVYRLAATVEGNLDTVMGCLDGAGIRYELVPVDDGSGDGSAENLRRAAERRPDVVRPVFVEQNAGKGNALKEGFKASRGEYVLLLDGDLDLSPKALPGFFKSMKENGSDIVVGSKRHPESEVEYPWHRRLASWGYFTLVKAFLGLPVTDTQTGMKLFRREALGNALERMLVKTYAFDLELLSIAFNAGAKVSEAPVQLHFGEKFGALSWKTVKAMAMDSLAVFYRTKLLDYYSKVEVPPPLGREPKVSVIIACPGGSWMLEECLAAIGRQTYRNYEVLVLPDGELDLSAYGDKVRAIATGKARPAEKRNLGIAESAGEIAAFIDDDAYPDPKWLECAVKYFSLEDVGAVGGPGVTPPGDGFWERAGGRVYENVLVSGGYRYRYVGGRVRRDVDDFPSCNLLVRMELLKKFGGFRTDFWPGEDTLLCKSITSGEKKRIVYDPWATVYHHRRRLFGAHLRQLGRYGFHRGYFAKRHPENSRHLAYFVPSAFVAYLAGLGVACGAAACGAFGEAAGIWLGAAAAPLGVYLAATGATTFSARPGTWLATWAGVAASHVCYGVKFMQGLLAKSAPCEYIGKDHA